MSPNWLPARTAIAVLALLFVFTASCFAQETLTIDLPECAGMSGFRAHWDMSIPVAEDGQRVLRDTVIKDRGQTAVWDGKKPGPLAFDAVHRHLLVRFPAAAEKIAAAIREGKQITKVELVLPHLDEELWPTGSGGADFPSPDGYRYRTNWDCDKLYRAERPNWHAVAAVLRKPWQADATLGPTYNAATKDAVYWKRFGASDKSEDRFDAVLGPTEVSSYKPEGRMDVTSVLTDPAYGKTLGERLRVLSDNGFILNKWEVYDARYFQGAYEFAISTGPRAILIKQPKLVVTFAAAAKTQVDLPPAANIADLAAKYKSKPLGAPTAIVPTPAEVAKLNERFMAKPAWMPEDQYKRVLQLMALEAGRLEPFYYRIVPQHVINRAKEIAAREAAVAKQPVDADYAVYLAWLDWVNGRPPRYWEGHLTAADNATQWYLFRDALPAPVQESILRSWNAWLMPDRETAMTDKERQDFTNTTGKLIHPMADDPRVGIDPNGKRAEWNQGNTYYKLTGDWRGNKSYYRSGFTRMISTANFNSSASSGALLNGQIIGSQNAIADGRAGLMKFPFWMWTYNSGVGQEYIDHYYWAIATAGNKMFPDFCEDPLDQAAGDSIIFKTVNDLALGYHPNLKKLLGPASRTYYAHVLGVQDGLYHIMHVISPKGTLSDLDTGALPQLTSPASDRVRPRRPVSAWGHDYSPAQVALQSMSGPWSQPWLVEMLDEKSLPWSAMAEKEGDWVSMYYGVNYGLVSIRQKAQRIHVLGHWRRAADRPTSMRDIGTLDMRIGFNDTQLANDGAGVITAQGTYRTYQHRNKLIMLARPNAKVIVEQAKERTFGQAKQPARKINSVQCTTALFNYESPKPTWEIYIDDKRIQSLPATARNNQLITIRDGVSYIAIRALNTTNLGREADITLEAGTPQPEAYHEENNIQAALMINANFYREDPALQDAIPAEALKKLEKAQSGFVVEMGDASEFPSFEAFQTHARKAALTETDTEVTYASGNDKLTASWDSFAANGQDPVAAFRESRLLQDTPMSQFGRSNLQKAGASIERGTRHPELPMFLHAFPARKLYVATNPVPNYIDYKFREPGGVSIIADGPCSMGRWEVRDSRQIDITYRPFGLPYKQKDITPASMLFISGTAGKPKIFLNGKDISDAARPLQINNISGYVISLSDPLPDDETIRARFK